MLFSKTSINWICYFLVTLAFVMMLLVSTSTYVFKHESLKIFYKTRYGEPRYRPLSFRMNSTQTKIAKSMSCKESKFKKVLLAVNFNHPFFDNIPALKKLYGPVFGKIVFCADAENKEHGVIGTDDQHPDIGGWVGYNCLVKAAKLYPHGYDGYLYTNDDVLINWWNLLDFHLNKIWTSKSYKEVHFQSFDMPLKGWWWWPKINGMTSCVKVFERIESLSQERSKEGERMQSCLKRYLAFSANKKGCYLSYSDVFYVPNSKIKDFVAVASMFVKSDVFLELAVHTILVFLQEKQSNGEYNIEHLHGLYLPDFYPLPQARSGEAFYLAYQRNISFLHPFKLGGQFKKKNINFFNENFGSYSQLMLKRCTH